MQGKRETFRFAAAEAGLLQRKMVTPTQAEHSPSSIVKLTRSLINKWGTYGELLDHGPERVRELWDNKVPDVDTAKAGKKRFAYKQQKRPRLENPRGKNAYRARTNQALSRHQ